MITPVIGFIYVYHVSLTYLPRLTFWEMLAAHIEMFSHDFIDQTPTLDQFMAWCHQAYVCLCTGNAPVPLAAEATALARLTKKILDTR